MQHRSNRLIVISKIQHQGFALGRVTKRGFPRVLSVECIRCILDGRIERKIRPTFRRGPRLRYRKFNSRVNRSEFIARTKGGTGLGWPPRMNTELSSGRSPIRFPDNTFCHCSSRNAFVSYIQRPLCDQREENLSRPFDFPRIRIFAFFSFSFKLVRAYAITPAIAIKFDFW